VLQFLAAEMTNIHIENTQGPSLQQQLDKYMMELQSHKVASGKEFWMECHSLASLTLDLLSAPASEAYVERIFSSMDC